MACTFDYIEDSANGFTQDQKDDLTKAHIDVAKSLYRHRFGNKSGAAQIFRFSNGKLIVPTNSASSKEAQAYIDLLNSNGEIVKLIVDANNPLRSYVSIDVRPIASKGIDVDQESMSRFMRNYFGDSAIVTTSEFIEDEALNAQHSKVWNKLTKSIKGKAALYLNSVRDSGDHFGTNKTKSQLKELLAILGDKNSSGVMEGLSTYIVNAGHNLSNLRARLAIIDEKIKTLSPDLETRKQQLSEISNFVRHSSYYYHLFDVMEDIAREFSTVGIQEQALDNYERDLLEDGLKEFMTSNGFNETETLDFLNQIPVLIETPGLAFSIVKDMMKARMGAAILTIDIVDKMEKDFNTVLEKSVKPEGGIINQLKTSLEALRPFKGRLKDLHYETLTEIYYPIVEDAWKRADAEYQQKFPLDKESFKTLLSIGEEDIDAFTRMGSAMINVNELVSSTIANYFKDLMIDVDIVNKNDVAGTQRVITGKQQSALDEVYKNAVYEGNIIESIQEVDPDYVPKKNEEIQPFTMFGETRNYVTRKGKFLVSEFDSLGLANDKKVFGSMVQNKALEYADLLLDDGYALLTMNTNGDPLLNHFKKMLYYTSKTSGDQFLQSAVAKLITAGNRENLADKIKGLLYASFNKETFVYYNNAEINAKFKADGIMDASGNLVDLNNDSNKNARKAALNSKRWVEFKKENLTTTFKHSKDSLFAVTNKNVKRVLVQYVDGTYGYIDVYALKNNIVYSDPNNKPIQHFAIFNERYKKVNNAKYRIDGSGFNTQARTGWAKLQSDAFSKSYYKHLMDVYMEANDNLKSEGLRHNEIPQVHKMDEASLSDKIKNVVNKTRNFDTQALYDYMGEYIVNENKFALRDKLTGELVDEEGVVTKTPVYQTSERQYVNGQKVREISAKFTKPVSLENIETDLYKSILMFKTSSNLFRSLKDNESQALLIQSIIEGDKTLGIDPRKMKIKKLGKDVLVTGGQVAYKEHNVNTSKMILGFLNDYMYGITTEDYGILGTNISAKKVARVVSGYTAYTSLAWNFMTMPSNALISLHNTRSVAKGNEFFNEKHWREAISEYTKATPQFFNDFTKKGLNIEKSLMSQLIVRFNAIQGEFLSPKGQIVSKNVGQKLTDSALFWTQEVVEHANQTQSMIMIAKGFNLPSGISLWDAIKETNKDRKEGTEVLMPAEFTPEIERQFQKRLQAVNMIIHGNYSKLDQNELQKGILTNMFMMFRKYIYDGFRSRFQSERPDIQTATIQEGYFRTYFKQLNQELTTDLKTQGLTMSMTPKILKAVGTSLLKSTIGGLDAASFRILSKSNAQFKDFIYGPDATLTDRQRYAAIRSTYGIGNVIRLLIVVAVAQALAEGLDDDDEEMRQLLGYVELFSRKLESDIGFFESFTNVASGAPGFTTVDQVRKIFRDPFVAYRSIDNTVGIFKQLTDFDTINEDGDFEFHWGAFDQYEKSGKGYEKGDYKIARKAQKSLVSPIYQIYKLGDVTTQLDYMNMTFKYSK